MTFLGALRWLVCGICLHTAIVLHSRHDVYGARQHYLYACSFVNQLKNIPKSWGTLFYLMHKRGPSVGHAHCMLCPVARRVTT